MRGELVYEHVCAAITTERFARLHVNTLHLLQHTRLQGSGLRPQGWASLEPSGGISKGQTSFYARTSIYDDELCGVGAEKLHAHYAS